MKEKNEEEIASWKIAFELDKEVKDITSWEAEVKRAGTKFVLESKEWNGPTSADMVCLNLGI